MKRVAFVLPEYSLPVPSVMGGAVEQLLDILIEENENKKELELTFLTPYFSKKIMEKLNSFNFENTHFIYIKDNKFLSFFIRLINKVLRVLKIKKQFSTIYTKRLINEINKREFDKIIFEGNSLGVPRKLLKYYDRKNIYLHLHSQILNKKDIFPVFGNLIGVSDFISNDWADWLKENKIKDVDVVTLKNCVDEERFIKKITFEEREQIRNSFGFKESDFIVIFCGRITPVKGVLELMQAIIKLPENIKLLLVGSPEFARKQKTAYLKEVQRLANAHSQKIKFTGFIPNAELYKYYQSADLQAIPSTYNDAAPLVVFEGLYSGLPQLVTRSGGILNYISEEGAVVIDRVKDVCENLRRNILILSQDKNLCKKMRRANLDRAKEFNKRKYFNDFVEIIK